MLCTHITVLYVLSINSKCLRGKKKFKFLQIKVDYVNFRIYNVKFK